MAQNEQTPVVTSEQVLSKDELKAKLLELKEIFSFNSNFEYMDPAKQNQKLIEIKNIIANLAPEKVSVLQEKIEELASLRKLTQSAYDAAETALDLQCPTISLLSQNIGRFNVEDLKNIQLPSQLPSNASNLERFLYSLIKNFQEQNTIEKQTHEIWEYLDDCKIETGDQINQMVQDIINNLM